MDDADLDELRFLTRALRAHLDWQTSTGATGLERATQETRVAAARELVVSPAPSREISAPPIAVAAEPLLRAPLPMAPADAPQRLAALAEVVSRCTRCGLCEQRTQTVFARGTGSSGVCFVGEGPGADEDAQGLPFVGKAGQLLDRMIAAMGFDRDEVYVCNVVKCRPPDNRKPELEEMAACLPYLHEQLELIRPQVIVALGATAVQGLLGTTEGITRLRGKWKRFGEIDVMPTFHPAYLLRTPAAKREVWEDLQEVMRRVVQGAPRR
ncbi:MAG: uracil-DNA glycosylase [Polyangiaceae bacterium]